MERLYSKPLRFNKWTSRKLASSSQANSSPTTDQVPVAAVLDKRTASMSHPDPIAVRVTHTRGHTSSRKPAPVVEPAIAQPTAPELDVSSLEEFNDAEYFVDVLQLSSCRTEDDLDAELATDAVLHHVVLAPLPETEAVHARIAPSPLSQASNVTRPRSSDSAVTSTPATSARSSQEQKQDARVPKVQFTFDDYDSFLGRQNDSTAEFGIPSSGAAPSLFSVSTRKSYTSIRNDLKHRFRLARKGTTKAHNGRYVHIAGAVPDACFAARLCAAAKSMSLSPEAWSRELRRFTHGV
jgi:hypothetical protein